MLCLGALALAESAVAQEVYRWVDSSGNVYYSDAEPLDVDSSRVLIETPVDGPVAVIEHAEAPLTVADLPAEADLATAGLGPCARARQQLTLLHTNVPVFLGKDGLWRGAGSASNIRSWLADATRPNAIRAARGEVLRRCSDPDAVAAELGRQAASGG